MIGGVGSCVRVCVFAVVGPRLQLRVFLFFCGSDR